jgi:hydrogenase maturation factor
MSKVDEVEAKETLRILEELGQYEAEFDQFKTTVS